MSEDYLSGHYYSFEAEGAVYGVFKVLAVEQKGVHVLVYANTFRGRPSDIEPEKLEVLAYHFPVTRGVLKHSKALHFQEGFVEKSDLLGYEEWRKAQGGFLDDGRL
jgi:hypothetical protein